MAAARRTPSATRTSSCSLKVLNEACRGGMILSATAISWWPEPSTQLKSYIYKLTHTELTLLFYIVLYRNCHFLLENPAQSLVRPSDQGPSLCSS